MLVEVGGEVLLELGLVLVGELAGPGDQLAIGADVVEHERGEGVQAVAEQDAAGGVVGWGAVVDVEQRRGGPRDLGVLGGVVGVVGIDAGHVAGDEVGDLVGAHGRASVGARCGERAAPPGGKLGVSATSLLALPLSFGRPAPATATMSKGHRLEGSR